MPSCWELIKLLPDALSIPVIANGEVWTARKASLEHSDYTDMMLGRGAVTRPDLVRQPRGGSDMSLDEPSLWLDCFLFNETNNSQQQLGRQK